MKETILMSVTVSFVVIVTLIALAFQKGGSATSTCSSLFVTCNATCDGTYIYSTANCEGSSLFRDCMCDGLMKNEIKLISADSIQLKNISRFIDYASALETSHKKNLVINLNKIKNAIKNEDYKNYKSGIERFHEISSQISEKERHLLYDRIKEHTTQQ
ncbi:MAG: hypothetical protein WD077_05135 [Bacteroidia bacterium]